MVSACVAMSRSISSIFSLSSSTSARRFSGSSIAAYRSRLFSCYCAMMSSLLDSGSLRIFLKASSKSGLNVILDQFSRILRSALSEREASVNLASFLLSFVMWVKFKLMP